jgi:pyridoxamine 5'-phosphate oxidase
VTGRPEYDGPGLSQQEADPDPFIQFGRWYQDAAHLTQPDTMILATSMDGRPSARAVLLKAFDSHGFVFYTNYLSRKGRELNANPNAALCFVWLELHRQVRIEGHVGRITPDESDTYFATRPVGAQQAAAASPQSEVIPDRAFLEKRLLDVGEAPARPQHWGGYRLRPNAIEFWQGRPNRLHDRLRYRSDGSSWVIERLAP